MKKYIANYISLFILLSIGLISCTQETYEAPELITSDMLDAGFTVELVSANNYLITANSLENIIFHEWDLDNGLGFVQGTESSELSLPDAGDYEIIHRVAGAGGIYSSEVSTVVSVPVSDPIAGNIVRGGKFDSEANIAEWTIGGTGSVDGVWTFADNKATLTASDWAGRGIYQAIEVEEGRSYQIDMYVSSTSGCTDTWFEVYCGYSDPAASSEDYSDGGKLLEISTWGGTATAAFGQNFSTIATNPEANGVFTATATGTVYLVIRGGGADMQDGISITNVEMRGIVSE